MVRGPGFLCEFSVERRDTGERVNQAALEVDSVEAAVRWIRVAVRTALPGFEGETLRAARAFLANGRKAERELREKQLTTLTLVQGSLTMVWLVSPIAAGERRRICVWPWA
ncbi:hypothetical protein A8W25_15580 [Streptomyces sp. ERV7]|uniref:hypothetical protein n=1 Tax=Streptomyces sp. ERV7 TaxID=1322334 RepID=UPI0007F4D691|nr:hypothetical protein [Streptomyces sp. ERV7]OAR23905.1 hypothetical protein A8W25_15580 [Streptomyces sp. ERV7]